ncbi:MAG: YceI family protein [Leptonema sp. (in: bacteria)]
MNLKLYLVSSIVFIILCNDLIPRPTPYWKIDKERSYIKFEIPILYFTVKGNIKNFSLKKNFNYNGYYKSLKNKELWIDISSIYTESKYRDEFIMSEFLLNHKQYPYSIIKIIEIYQLDKKSNYYLVTFEIQIKSIKKQITELVYIENYLNKFITRGQLSISRNDYDLKGNLLLNALMDEYIHCEYYLEILYTYK